MNVIDGVESENNESVEFDGLEMLSADIGAPRFAFVNNANLVSGIDGKVFTGAILRKAGSRASNSSRCCLRVRDLLSIYTYERAYRDTDPLRG